MSFIVYHLMWLKLTTLNMVSIRSLEWQGKNGTIHLREDIQNYRFENQNRHPMHVYKSLTKSEHMHISSCCRKYTMRSSSHLIACSMRWVKSVNSTRWSNKIVGQRGNNRIGSVASSERGDSVTVAVHMSAAGWYIISTMFIFKWKRMKAELCNGAPPGTVFSVHGKGWMRNNGFFSGWSISFV